MACGACVYVEASLRELLIVIERPPKASKSGQNRRAHWRAGHREDAAAHRAAYLLTKVALAGRPAPAWTRVRVVITWISARRQWPDRLNWCALLKAHFDGIFEALGLDDSIVEDFGELAVDRERPRVELPRAPSRPWQGWRRVFHIGHRTPHRRDELIMLRLADQELADARQLPQRRCR